MHNKVNQVSKDNNVVNLLYKHSAKKPDKIAFRWDNNKSVSYKDFSQKVSNIANNLKKLGITKGDRIIIFVPFTIELYLSMFALQQLGAIAVFIDSWARRDQLEKCYQIVSAKGMISNEKVFDFCKDLPEIKNLSIKISLDSIKEDLISFNSLLISKESFFMQEVYPEDTALITFTTGSSAAPKGANRTHKFLLAQHNALKQVIPYQGDEIDLPVFPIFALNNIASGITTLLPNINLALPSDDDGQKLTDQILLNKTTCCTLSPSLFIKVSEYCHKNQITLPFLKRVVTGGAPISKDNVEHFKIISPFAEILVLYGSTEVEPIAHIEANTMLSYLGKNEGVNVGHISKDLEYKFIKITKDPIILNNGWSDWLVEKGKIGELIVSGSHVCKNYYNDTEAFNRTKILDKNKKIWHRTGDLGYLDSENYLWFVGRVHNAINRLGQFIFPVQAELLLKKLKFVRQAAFIGIKNVILGEKTIAVISLKQNLEKSQLFIEEIISLFQKNNIPIDQVKIIPEIPMDPRHHSKVEYQKLLEILENG